MQDRSLLLCLHINGLIIWIRGGGDVQRTAHIFDDDIWALSHGKFNIPGYKGEIHLIHAPVEVQFVHLIADAQLTSLPGEVRGGAGEKIDV